MAINIQLRRDSAAQWISTNPVLLEGELGLETDTKRYKIGDGLNSWNLLQYGGLTLNNTTVEVIQVSPLHILDKKLSLSLLPAPSMNTRLHIQGGPTQVINIDYIVVGNEVMWNALGLELLLESGMFLIIEYYI
jgi:hypothetical protein